jgi:hypothetical protein
MQLVPQWHTLKGSRKELQKKNETWILTWDFFKLGILGGSIRIMDHIAHGTLPGLEGNDWFEYSFLSCEIWVSLPFRWVSWRVGNAMRTWCCR